MFNADDVVETSHRSSMMTRGSVEVMIEAVAELFLLSETRAFIATYASTFSTTA